MGVRRKPLDTAQNDRDNAELVRRLLLMMDRHNVSQNAIAPKLGIEQTAISSWKVKGSGPRAVYLARFIPAFQDLTGIALNPRWLLLGEGEPYAAAATEAEASSQAEFMLLAEIDQALGQIKARVAARHAAHKKSPAPEGAREADAIDRLRAKGRGRQAS